MVVPCLYRLFPFECGSRFEAGCRAQILETACYLQAGYVVLPWPVNIGLLKIWCTRVAQSIAPPSPRAIVVTCIPDTSSTRTKETGNHNRTRSGSEHERIKPRIQFLSARKPVVLCTATHTSPRVYLGIATGSHALILGLVLHCCQLCSVPSSPPQNRKALTCCTS